MIDAATRRPVRERAGDRCEYCRLHQNQSELLHHIEHVVARRHGGTDHVDNLALACHRCNLHKRPNLSGVDPFTAVIVSLFNPRDGRWKEHFAFRQEFIEGLTPTGRATVEVLALNDARRLALRRELWALCELN